MSEPDLYKFLNLNSSASQDEIKQAYRKLAVKYHPDKNKDSSATQKFQEISTAYEILSDPDKRKQYDQSGSDQNLNKSEFFSNIFTTFFSMIRIDKIIPVTYQELLYGSSRNINITRKVFLKDGHPVSGTVCSMCQGNSQFIEMIGIICSCCQGTGKQYPPGTVVTNQTTTQKINIPPRSWSQRVLNVGDQKIQLQPVASENLYHESKDLIFVQPLDVFTALLGFSKNVEIVGKVYHVQYCQPIEPGTEMSLPNAGLYDRNGNRGNLIIVFDVSFPKQLTDRQKKYIRKCQH